MIPLIKGMVEYLENPVAGVILNRCSKGMFQMMKGEIEKVLPLKVVGYFPQKEGIHIGSRHLGLMTAAEIHNLDQVIDTLGKTAEEGIDLDAILEIGAEASPLSPAKSPPLPRPKTRIAVAEDKAFCFYYQENLDILEEFGAELVPFSPVNDKTLPENIGGIYLGGGYPETYRKELSENEPMTRAIRQAARMGKPIMAECGGFMYVCKNLIETDGTSMPMLGLIDTDVQMTDRLSMQFGYVTLTAREDSPYFNAGDQVRVHEFHYSKAGDAGDAAILTKSTGRSWEGLHIQGRILAGYPHFYFHNCKGMARRFVDMAAEFSARTCL